MSIFKQIEGYGHEKVLFATDKKTGLKCIVSIHDTTLGPACGGTRFWNYESDEDAIYDVLRLSRGMTLKNAAAGLAVGGGKAVIIGDPKKLKSEEFFKAYGRIIDSLGGLYYTAEDVNISTHDIDIVNTVTPYVMGTSAITGDPSPFTARGVFQGMKAGASIKFGSDSLKGKVVAIQGLGSVGMLLAKHLYEDGAILKVTDINQEAIDFAVKNYGATAVPINDIVTTDCDVFAPCALGAILNVDNVRHLKCELVCGAANNVLVVPEVGNILEELNILYLPDYIVNAGGIINCAPEALKEKYDVDNINKKVDEIYDTTKKVVELARKEKISTYAAADMYALSIIENAKK